MFNYFRNPVQEIQDAYPHPVEQFIVLSLEGHHDAANRIISDYAEKYRNDINKIHADFVSGKKHGFDAEDIIQVEEKIRKKFSNIPSRLYASFTTLEEIEEACDDYTSIIEASIDAARNKSEGLKAKIISEGFSKFPKDKQDQLIDEATALDDRIKVLSLFRTTAECLSKVNNKEANATAEPIPSGPRCSVM